MPEEQATSEKTLPRESLYSQARGDLDAMPRWGRVALAILCIFVFFKLTPILDLLWLFFQIVVIPFLVLVSLGVISESVYQSAVGWLNDALIWSRTRVRENLTPTTEESTTEQPTTETSA